MVQINNNTDVSEENCLVLQDRSDGKLVSGGLLEHTRLPRTVVTQNDVNVCDAW